MASSAMVPLSALSDLKLDQLEDDLRAKGVSVVVGSVVDLGGVARAKTVPLRRLGSFARSGMGASPTWNVFCIDDAIAFTDRFTVAGDLRLRLDAGAMRVVADGVAWAPAEFTVQEGGNHPVDTRSLLRRVTAGLAADGYAPLAGCEVEFILFPEGGAALASAPWAAYGLASVLDPPAAGFTRRLVEDAEQVGLPLEQVHAEYGRNQFEISLAPTDPVTAADNVILARLLIGRAAAAAGLRASFSPLASPNANAANGAHQHISLTRGGVPVFSGGDGPHGLRREGGAAIAGILGRLPDFLGFYAGSVLSGTRLLPGHWSGAHLCWGLENREAAVRLCAATVGNPHGASIELKVVDASANPYLALAALLWCAHEGIRRELPLPAEVAANPADLPHQLRVPTLTASQPEVLDVLASSAAATEFAGADIMEALLAVRRHEVGSYGQALPSELAERFRFTWSV
jgi:glutamine synthetase